MRYLAVALLCCLAQTLKSADPPSDMTWETAFQAISPSTADSQLVLLLVTNDHPFAIDSQVTDDQQADTRSRIPWCSLELRKALSRSLAQRPDLEERLQLQTIAAGIPMELTGGVSRNQPARAVVLLCDGYYRLLAFNVGVPDADSLLTLIEDAEDVQRSMNLDTELTQIALAKTLVERNRPRLSRMWRNVLSDVAVTFQGDADETVRAADIHPVAGSVFRVAETFQTAYEVDARLRFGLSDASDRRRLAILEQHPEVRKPWCQSILPFIVGIQLTEHWRELIESVWGFPPITADVDISEIQRWTATTLTSTHCILSVTPPQRLARLPWPPDAEDKRGKAWHEVHQLATDRGCRNITLQELSILLRQLGSRPIDAFQPSLARYVVLEKDGSNPLVIRDIDPPGRFAAVLKDSSANPRVLNPPAAYPPAAQSDNQ